MDHCPIIELDRIIHMLVRLLPDRVAMIPPPGARVHGDSCPEHRPVPVLHGYTLLRDAEFLAAVRPDATRADCPTAPLANAWRLLLGGYRGDAARGAAAEAIGAEVLADSLASYTAHIDTCDLAHPFIVWNTLSFARSGLISLPWSNPGLLTVQAPRTRCSRTQCSDDAGRPCLLAEVIDVPPMGYTVCDLREKATRRSALAVTDCARASRTTLENDLVRVRLDRNGGIVSYVDKLQARELILPNAPGNALPCATPATIAVTESGPLRATLRVERHPAPEVRMVQWVRLEANSRRLDLVTEIDGPARSVPECLDFPVAIQAEQASLETLCGHVRRPAHRNTDPRARATMGRWADLSQSDYGIALLQMGALGCDAGGRVLRLYLPGPGRFTCSLLPHRGEVVHSGLPLAAHDLTVPLFAQPLPVQVGMLARSHSYFRLDHLNLVIEGVKRAEDGNGLIVRLSEAYHRSGVARLIVNGLCAHAARTDACERNIESLAVHGGAITLAYRPFDIITLRLW